MKQKVFDLLDSLMIDYKNYEHVPVFTCEDCKGVDIPGLRVKSLLLRNKKSTKYYMVVLPDDKHLDTNIVREFFEDSKLSFVDSELMQGLIGVKPGSVSPYALINNQEKNISVIFDSSLIGKDIGLHPLQNDNTIVSNFENIKKYLIHLGFDIHVLEL